MAEPGLSQSSAFVHLQGTGFILQGHGRRLVLQLALRASITCAHVARACDLSLAVPPVQTLVPPSVRVEAGEQVATLRVEDGCIPMTRVTDMLDVELRWVRLDGIRPRCHIRDGKPYGDVTRLLTGGAGATSVIIATAGECISST